MHDSIARSERIPTRVSRSGRTKRAPRWGRGKSPALIRQRSSEKRPCRPRLGDRLDADRPSMPNWSGCIARKGLSFAKRRHVQPRPSIFPIQPFELQSYRRFMREHLFDLVDNPPGKCACA